MLKNECHCAKQTLNEICRVSTASKTKIDEEDANNLGLIQRKVQIIQQKLNEIKEQIEVCLMELFANVS